MKHRILIDCGAAETRAAFLVGDEPVRFWFGPARGDEALKQAPERGDVFAGRVRTVSKPLHGAFVDIGAGADAFFPFGKRDRAPAEGALLPFIVRRPPLGDKGAVVARAAWEGDMPPSPGPLGEPADAAVAALGQVAPEGALPEDIVVSDFSAAQALRAFAPAVRIEPAPFEVFDVDEWIERALDRTAPLEGGGQLVIDECEGLTVVDVDSGEAAGRAAARLNDQVNAAAARALPRELSRRAIGGRVVVDFLPSSGAAQRSSLVAAMKERAAGVLDARFGKLSADGLFDINIRRDRRSLLETASEPAGAGLLRAGRRATLDWTAKAAMRALEYALVRERSARLRLACGAALAAYINARPQWAARAASKYGARFDIVENTELGERAFDLR